MAFSPASMACYYGCPLTTDVCFYRLTSLSFFKGASRQKLYGAGAHTQTLMTSWLAGWQARRLGVWVLKSKKRRRRRFWVKTSQLSKIKSRLWDHMKTTSDYEGKQMKNAVPNKRKYRSVQYGEGIRGPPGLVRMDARCTVLKCRHGRKKVGPHGGSWCQFPIHEGHNRLLLLDKALQKPLALLEASADSCCCFGPPHFEFQTLSSVSEPLPA